MCCPDVTQGQRNFVWSSDSAPLKADEKSCCLAVTVGRAGPQLPEMLVGRVCGWAALVLALEPGSQVPSPLPPELQVGLQVLAWNPAHRMSQSIMAAETEGNLTKSETEGADPDAGAPWPRPGPVPPTKGVCTPAQHPCSHGILSLKERTLAALADNPAGVHPRQITV